MVWLFGCALYLGGVACGSCFDAICSLLFLYRAALRHFRQVLAFIDGFVEVESTVACSVLGDVGVSVVTGADDVSVKLQVACGFGMDNWGIRSVPR